MWSIHKTLEFFKGTPESFSGHCVQRDELSYQSNYKKNDHLHQPLLDKIKGDDVVLDEIKFVDHHHGLLGDRKVNLRVKVKMTKDEAARLIGKCRDQKGTLEFRDVALELVKIPSHRIIEVSAIERT